MAGVKPSALIEAIHDRLPYFTHTPFQGDNVTIDSIFDDIVRAGGWAGIILCMALVLSIITCCCCCCMCCVCCIKRREKPLALKLLLGIVTGSIVVVGIILVFVSFWAESSLHNSIANEATKIVDFTNSSDVSDIVDTVVLFVEQRRHTTFVVYFVILLLFLVGMLAVLALAPVCKNGVGVIVMIVVMGFFTVFNSMLVAATFAVIVVYADVCIGLFSLNIDILNTVTAAPTADFSITLDFSEWGNHLDVFCNQSVNYGFTLFMLSAVLVILFVLIQIFGFAYGSSFFGRKPDTISVRASEVWNSDGMDGVEPTLNVVYEPQRYASEDQVPLMSVVEDD